MVFALPAEGRPHASAQALARLFAGRAGAGDGFDCGVRVVSGTLAGEGRFWRYRASAVEPRTPGPNRSAIVLHHGRDTVLRLRLDPGSTRHRLRPGYVVVTAQDLSSLARVKVSVRPEILERLQT